MEFLVNLIETSENLTDAMKEDLKANCTFIKNNIWIYEGDQEALNARFRVLDTGIVCCLGDLSENELIELCKDTFDFDHSLLK